MAVGFSQLSKDEYLAKLAADNQRKSSATPLGPETIIIDDNEVTDGYLLSLSRFELLLLVKLLADEPTIMLAMARAIGILPSNTLFTQWILNYLEHCLELEVTSSTVLDEFLVTLKHHGGSKVIDLLNGISGTSSTPRRRNMLYNSVRNISKNDPVQDLSENCTTY